MITKIFFTSILLIGATLTINGMVTKSDYILASANLAVGQANIQQFKKALDLYYIDHGSYPATANSEAMIDLLKEENYITENAPIKPGNFNYQVIDDGQNYSLSIAQQIK